MRAMGRPPTGVSPDTEAQRYAVAKAREAVEQFLNALQFAAGHPQLPMSEIRGATSTGTDSAFGKHFRPHGTCNFRNVASKVHDALAKLGDNNPEWRTYLARCAAKKDAALHSLNEVLEAFGADAKPLPPSERDLAPFSPIDPSLDIFIGAASDARLIPMPSFEDYKARRVVDDRHNAIFTVLEDNKLCHVRGVPSAGKTTAALVAVFRVLSKTFEGRYLRLTHVVDPLATGSAFRTMLAEGERQVIVIDDAQRDPELTRDLLRAWKAQYKHDPAKCPRLLMIGTRIAYPDTVPQTLRMDWPDETIDLSIGPDQLGAIARFYIFKATGREVGIPSNVAHNWSKSFGNHLHAFCFSLLAAARQIGVGNYWVLSRKRGLEWISDNWLHTRNGPFSAPIASEEHQNLNCLCVFADQDLEMTVPESALPCPTILPLRHCRTLGIVSQRRRLNAAPDDDAIFHLMEHGWGGLILEAGGVSQEDRKVLRRSAMIKRLELFTTAARRLRTRKGTLAVRQLNEELDFNGELIPSIVNDSMGRAAGCMLYLAPADPDRARKVLEYAILKVNQDQGWVTNATIGQLAKFCDQAGEGIVHAKDKYIEFIESVAAIAPPQHCPLIESIPSGVSPTHLKIFQRLPVQSPMHQALQPVVRDAVPQMMNRVKTSSPQTMVDTVVQINSAFPDLVERALDILYEHDTRDLLARELTTLPWALYNSLVTAVFRPFTMQPDTRERLADLFLAPLSGTDWASRAHDDMGLGGAPWLANKLYRQGLTEDAANLADLVALRKNEKDLNSGANSKGNKRIEMIAIVCRLCRSQKAAQNYLDAMIAIVQDTLEKPSLYSGIAAAGLYSLAVCDSIRPADAQLLQSASLRAHHRRGTRSDRPITDQQISDYIQYIGACTCIWPPATFREQIVAFVYDVGLAAVVNNPGSLPRVVNPPIDFLEPIQFRYWLGLRAIAHILEDTLVFDRQLIEQICRLAQGALAYDVDQGDSLKVIERNRALIAWLNDTLAGEGDALQLSRSGDFSLQLQGG